MAEPRIELGEWVPLPDGIGDGLAVRGDRSAAVTASQAVLWRGTQREAWVELDEGPAGIPRFVGERLHFGPGWVEDGHWVGQPAPPPTVHGRVRTSAWSLDGRRVALLVEGPWSPSGGGGPTAGPSSLLVERTREGTGRVVAADPGVSRVWATQWGIIGVGRELRVWEAGGERVIGPAHEAEAIAVSGSDDDRWLLTVGSEGAAWLWDCETWEPPVAWAGAWRGGGLSPNGRWAVGIDLRGDVHLAARVGTALMGRHRLVVEGGVRAVALGAEDLVVSCEIPPFHRRIRVQVS